VVKMAKDYYAPMHTAEHILNQTMVRMFNCGRSFSMHLEKKKSKCDYHFDRNLTDEEVAVIETKLNELINADLQVTEEFISKEEAGKLFDLKRLPEGTGDTIRIIKVGDYDACPCIGAHVKSTKEIGGFKIISSSFEEGVLRVRYRLIEPE
jgi:Ser-tRNA(Ala) deacylase AlaX